MHAKFRVDHARVRISLRRHPTRARVVVHHLDALLDVRIEHLVVQCTRDLGFLQSVPVGAHLAAELGGDAEDGAEYGPVLRMHKVAHLAKWILQWVSGTQEHSTAEFYLHQSRILSGKPLRAIDPWSSGVSDGSLHEKIMRKRFDKKHNLMNSQNREIGLIVGIERVLMLGRHGEGLATSINERSHPENLYFNLCAQEPSKPENKIVVDFSDQYPRSSNYRP